MLWVISWVISVNITFYIVRFVSGRNIWSRISAYWSYWSVHMMNAIKLKVLKSTVGRSNGRTDTGPGLPRHLQIVDYNQTPWNWPLKWNFYMTFANEIYYVLYILISVHFTMHLIIVQICLIFPKLRIKRITAHFVTFQCSFLRFQ